MSYQEILNAVERIAPYIHRTPVHTCSTIDDLVGRKVFFKCENFQKTGSFKARGALNAVSLMNVLRNCKSNRDGFAVLSSTPKANFEVRLLETNLIGC